MSTYHLTQWFEESVISAPEKVAIVNGDKEITWKQMMQHVSYIASYLSEHGVKRGERVLVWLPNSIDFVACFWAVQYLQAVFVPVNPETPIERIFWLISNSESSMLISTRSREKDINNYRYHADLYVNNEPLVVLYDCTEKSSHNIETDQSLDDLAISDLSRLNCATRPLDVDLACLIYTSGSTGNPKGVMLTQRNMLSAATSVSSYLQLTEHDRIYCTIPMSFDYGLYQAIMAAKVGATLIIERDFTRPLFALSQLSKQRATIFPIVPSLLSIIAPLVNRYDLSSLKKITNTAAALHPSDIDKLTSLFPQAEIFSMYGLTECHRCTWLPPSMLKENKESVGFAIPNTEMWVVDDLGVAHTSDATGELVIRGATVMSGYWRNEEETCIKLRPGPIFGEKVLYTGDICRLDKNGLLYFISRKDDILKSCGEKVAPKEVESVLKRYPGVTQVAILGLPHPVYGQEIVACIEAESFVDITAIKDFCKANLEGYKCPHRYFIDSSLPKNPNGKIDKNMLATFLS